MQVWSVLHAARWKYRTQKFALCAPSYIFVGLYLRNEGMYRQSERIAKEQYLLHMSSQYGKLQPTITAEIGWRVWAPQQISMGFAFWLRYSDVAQRKSTKLCTVGWLEFSVLFQHKYGYIWDQPNFARCLTVSWAGTLYTLCPRKNAPLSMFKNLQH